MLGKVRIIGAGVEGYVESTACGLIAGINAARLLAGKPLLVFPPHTAIGALLKYISSPDRKDFQPMNISFGLMPTYLNGEFHNGIRKKGSKQERRVEVAQYALATIEQLSGTLT